MSAFQRSLRDALIAQPAIHRCRLLCSTNTKRRRTTHRGKGVRIKVRGPARIAGHTLYHVLVPDTAGITEWEVVAAKGPEYVRLLVEDIL